MNQFSNLILRYLYLETHLLVYQKIVNNAIKQVEARDDASTCFNMPSTLRDLSLQLFLQQNLLSD
jgi:hypothetical protein